MGAKVLVSGSCSVATEHPLASLAGSEVMRSGGNAFDAAVASSFVLSVVLPHMNGLGGDFFALFLERESGRVRCLNGSGWAPSGASVEALRRRGFGAMPASGPESVVVPGFVGGIEELHRGRGRAEFSSLLGRAMELAEDGFAVSPSLAAAVERHRTSLSAGFLQNYAGGRLRQRRLAGRLREIAEEGSGGFYGGGAAKEIERILASAGVGVDAGDFRFAPEWVEPLEVEYRGRRVFEVPPNSMGAAALMILKEIEREEPPAPDSLERVRLVTEATKAALEAKEELLGDPRFVRFDLESFLGSRPRRRGTPVSEGDTTYFAVADGEGNLLSCIQSLFHPFGSKVYLEGSGFFLNNRAAGFRLAGPNAIAPKKRPMHTLSALLLSRERGEVPNLAIGTSGGELRPQLHALFVSNVVDHSMDLERALGYPRFVWDGSETVVERGYSLGEWRHGGLRVVDYPYRQGVAQGVELTPEGRKGVCDIRGDGEPVGF